VATDPRDGDDAVLERLPQRLEDGAGELRQLIHEENPEVRERDLAGTRARAAADDGGRRGAVMRRANGGAETSALPEGSKPATE
jgi:hypothetical protein